MSGFLVETLAGARHVHVHADDAPFLDGTRERILIGCDAQKSTAADFEIFP